MSPHHLPVALGKVDGRTKKWRELHETYTALLAHVGMHPDFVQQEIIVSLLRTKERLAAAGNHEDFVRLSNAYGRLLRQLGPRVRAKEPTLQDYLRERTEQRATERDAAAAAA